MHDLTEREKQVVAWLRAMRYPVNTRFCRDLANAIERGEHVDPPRPE